MKRTLLLLAALLGTLLAAVPGSSSAGDDSYFAGVEQWRPHFYPIVQDRYRDSTGVYFTVDGDEIWDATYDVVNAEGRTLRTAGRIDFGEDYGDFYWNGRDDDQEIVKAGTFTIVVSVETFDGEFHNFSREVLVDTDVFTRRKHIQYVPGGGYSPHWDRKSVKGNCRAVKLHREALLDCWGGGHARAVYGVYVPKRGEEKGAGRVTNVRAYFGGETRCCPPGTVTKVIARPRPRIWRGTVTVTNWRAYSVWSFNVKYRYKKRI